MRRVLLVVVGSVLAAIVAGSGLVAGVPAPVARAESCSLSMTPSLKTAKGLLFTGLYLGKRWDGERRHRVHVFDVARVFAGGDVVQASTEPAVLSTHQSVTFDTGGCSAMRELRPGRRYLMSVGWLGPLTAWYGVAWELLPGDRVRLVMEYDGARMDPRLAGPSTLREVVTLMRPTYEPPYRGIPIDQLTGACPGSPATATAPAPAAAPASSSGVTGAAPAWGPVLRATGPVPLDAACAFDAVTAWSGGFVATAHRGNHRGRALIASWTSADAVTWTRSDPADAATARLQSGPTVAYGDGLVRFGDDGGALAAWDSADGVTWTRQPGTDTLRTPAAWLELQAAVSGAQVVVTGTSRDRCDVLGCRERTWTWTSADGRTWARTEPDDRLQPRPIHPIVGVEDGFIALGDHRRTLASADGATWRIAGALPENLLLTGDLAAIPGDASTYWVTLRNIDATYGTVVVSVQRSDDLRTWTEVGQSPETHRWPPVVATGSNGIVITGTGEDEVPWALSSADGTTWTRVPGAPGVLLGAPAAAAIGPTQTVVVSGGQNPAGALIWAAAMPSQDPR